MKIGFIPIDNRPVCYSLPQMIAGMNGNIELFMPEREWLGDLTKYADIEKIFNWLENLPKVDAVIISLDTVAYGGLISSRRCPDTFDEIKKRIYNLKQILSEKDAELYAFSSIMRIPDNNFSQEEKSYWSDYGKEIFEYSYNLDKFGHSETSVPKEILEDWLQTRKRNFEINKIYLKWQKENFFNTLVFSKDDCAEFGLNVKEAREIEALGGFVKTGADEIPLSLFARAIKGSVKIAPVFSEPEYKNLISNYEDVSVERSVIGQIELAGCEVSLPENADIILYVNNFKHHQGEIVMNVDTEPFDGVWKKPEKPYMIADVRFANGADNYFVKALFQQDFDKNFFGYSGWNTSANSLGSLICAGKIKFLAGQNYSDFAFKKLQVLRFLDDWAYQANVRQIKSDKSFLGMTQYEEIILDKFGVDADISYSYPWNRLFEIEINFISACQSSRK